MNEFDYIVLGIGFCIVLMYVIYWFVQLKEYKDLKDEYEKNLDNFAKEIANKNESRKNKQSETDNDK